VISETATSDFQASFEVNFTPLREIEIVEIVETNGSLMIQGQDYKMDALKPFKNFSTKFSQFLPVR